jgi:hypothetical protein
MLQVFFFWLRVFSVVVVEIVGMDDWMLRLEEARWSFLDDDEEDEANMSMALDQLQDLIDAPPIPRVVAGGSGQGKRANIERARVLMDERMHLDYFADAPVWGPFFSLALSHAEVLVFDNLG